MIPSKFNRLGIGKKLLTDDLTFIANINAARVKLVKSGNVDTSGIQYKIKGGYWSAYNIGDTITLTKKGDFVQFRNIKNTLSTGTSNYVHFQVLDSCKCEGNVMSMINRITTALPSYSFYQLFIDCEITTAPELPAMNLGPSCYRGMFTRCENLTEAPELPARTLKASCYYEMFMECTSLYIIPKLPATTLADYCYYEMFRKCSALTSVPANLLPAYRMSQYCYSNMFQGCTSLVLPPHLPAIELAIYCYQSMFQACYSLTTMPDLPATSLENYCYRNMFYLCPSLINTKALPAEVLANGCYYQMFTSCPKVNRIDASFTNWGAASCTQYWLDGTASTGTFIKYEFLPEIRNSSHIPTRWSIEYKDAPLTLLSKQAGSAVSLSAVNITLNDIQYRTNTNLEWEDYDTDTIIELQNENDFVQFKNINNNLFSRSATSYAQFMMSGLFEGYGNIQSLFLNSPDAAPQYSFINLFKGCTSLTKAPHLPATTLGSQCYSNMFNGCTALTYPPEINATSLGNNCCYQMFYGCTSLTSMPNLPVTTMKNYCYQQMFQGCTNLTSISELPAEILADGCYSDMFKNCTNLVTPPELPATELKLHCYRNMFQGCSKLNEVNVGFTDWDDSLSSTLNWLDGVSSSGTFYKSPYLSDIRGASNIPVDWDVEEEDIPLTLKATADGSAVKITRSIGTPETSTMGTGILYRTDEDAAWINYTIDDVITLDKGDYVQFMNLSSSLSVNDVLYVNFKMSGTIEGLGNIQSMLNWRNNCPMSCFNGLFLGCTSLITPPRLPATTIMQECYKDMFKNCTNLITAPELPATSVANSCYKEMFRSCTSLTTTPYLPALTLDSYCYRGMFQGCTGLTSIKGLPATTLANYCYYYMFFGCTSLTAAPELPAITLNNHCYQAMFQGCSNLNYIKVYFTSWPTSAVDALTNWLTGTAASGLFVKSSLLPVEGSEGYIPSGWTIEEFLAATRSLSKNRKRMTIASIRIGDGRNENYYTWF